MTIDPRIPLPPAMDYALLRREAYAWVERLGHERWTDYNAHDPGITLLEALCYALAETGYRLDFDIADLLTLPAGELRGDQSFYTARDILTVAPVTNDDLRRLLIDRAGVRNAWVRCNAYCTPLLYPTCAAGTLDFAPRWRTHPTADADNDPPVRVGGIHDLLLQLSPDARFGDLNSDRLAATLTYLDATGESFPLEVELWFPEWGGDDPVRHDRILDASRRATPAGGELSRLRIVRKETDGLTDDGSLHRHLNGLFYLAVGFTVELDDGSDASVDLPEVGLRLRVGSREHRRRLTVAGVVKAIRQADLLGRYLARLRARRDALKQVREGIEAARKVGEDVCRLTHIRPLEVGVCADLYLEGVADVEAVLASFYRTVERFLDPPVPFRTLGELTEMGLATEDIFLGPPLSRGFILPEDLERSRLRSRIAVSDIINLIMDLPGLAAVEGLRFTTYDREGRVRCSGREWSFSVPEGQYPKLYLGGSAVRVFKDGLPLQPRALELDMLLEQLRADDQAVALGEDQLDLPAPVGRYPGAYTYLPVQRSLPEVYGLSGAGLPAGASVARRAQAGQLAAYLHPLEKIAAATAARVEDFADLFSNDDTITAGWTDPEIADDGPAPLAIDEQNLLELDAAGREALIRDGGRAEAQRGRVLDHMLARFGERIDDYVGLVHDVGTRQQFGRQRLNQNKAGMLAGLAESGRLRSTNAGLARRLDDLLFTEGDGPLIVEHVRLRPKFPGDALMEVCLSDDCQHQGREDPYSFRITYLFNGEAELYNEDTELRRYANRLIRRETPVHLLPKICWATAAARERVRQQLDNWEALDREMNWPARRAELRLGTQSRLGIEAAANADLLLGYFGDVFRDSLKRELADDPATIELTDERWKELRDELWRRFEQDLEQIRERDQQQKEQLTASWKLAAGPIPSKWQDWLSERYAELVPVSLALTHLLAALEDTTSVYPVATLHDCDDGDDDNPVRLGNTSLGTFE